MQMSQACHLCMTNIKNNCKIILLAFCVHFMYMARIKRKNFHKCLQNVFETKIIHKAKMSTQTKPYNYLQNTVKYAERLPASYFFTCRGCRFSKPIPWHPMSINLSSTKMISFVCSCTNKCKKLEHMLHLFSSVGSKQLNVLFLWSQTELHK